MHLGQPDDCPDHVYQVMKNCWYKDASQRPNFTLIIAQLKQEDTTQYEDSSSPESPIHDKQPLYQNTGVSPDLSKSKLRQRSGRLFIPSKFEWGRGSRLVFCRLPGPVFIMSAGSFFQTAAGNRGL